MKTIKEMKARLRAISAEAAKVKEGDTETLNRLLEEAEDLERQISEAKNRKKLQGLANDYAEGSDGHEEGGNGENGEDPKDAATKRGKALLAGNAVKRPFKNAITSTSVVLPKHTATDVNETFNEVSSLIDRVKIVPLEGGESYKRGFVKSYGEGDYTAEGADAATAEPVFGYADIQKTKITAYCEEPVEIKKLAPAAYDEKISGSVGIAIKKKLSRQILVGDGKQGHLVGIFCNPESEADDIIDRKKDIEIAKIYETTLDDIIYEYGGDEDVEDAAVLVLNKKDLKAFAKCRHADGTKAYTIVNHGNVGTIDGVPYIINSACKAVSDPATVTGNYCMAYGNLSHYEVGVFSELEEQQSTEFRFKQGQIAFKGEMFVGGNVASYNGFVRVKKK